MTDRTYTLETYAGNTLRFMRFGCKIDAINVMRTIRNLHPDAKGTLRSLVAVDGCDPVIVETQEF